MKLFDVADPTDPIELAWWREPNAASFWTAQYAPGPGCFVASSRRAPPADDPEGAALYTFPDHAGTQVDPPSLDATTTPENGATTTTARTATMSTTTTTTTSTTTTTTTSTTTQSTIADTPGFGGITAVAALGTAGYAWLRRRRGGD